MILTFINIPTEDMEVADHRLYLFFFCYGGKGLGSSIVSIRTWE